ncbi:MAG: nucleotidyltransferase domain-containing protein, partial [Proteobacteria bacterium]|nr:nucleotidyltransferase domain-containing protein [Pseudomonadota bacterium]
MMEQDLDPILSTIVRTLRVKYKCHTVVLYGSRARGLQTSTSDYDVFGVCRRGKKFRIAKQQNGFYWDVFVYSEKDLVNLSDEHFSWKNARVLYQEGSYAKDLMSRLDKLLSKPFQKQPKTEINVLKVWAQKELDRCRIDDIQGLYRRVELLNAFVDHYYFIRQKRFWGPKAGFEWIRKHDPDVYQMILKSLKDPSNTNLLVAAASKVY